jgi:phage terminase large subunit-like protein
MVTVKSELIITTSDIIRELERRKYNQIEAIFPDDGPFGRELYPKHLDFFKAGKYHRERIFIAANRVGKTVAGGSERVYHLTGDYPHWWEGRRFNKNVVTWAAGDTGKTTRDIVQNKLLGPPGQFGTGLIPKDRIIRTLSKVGVPDAIEMAYIRHNNGKDSLLVFKSYDQRREAFQGTEVDDIWLDEEPPQDIYVECLLRTMTTKGIVSLTFTPLMGLSDVVLSFCPGGAVVEGELKDFPSKYVVACDWDSVPHLSQQEKDDLFTSIPPFQRDARARGIPQLGSGAIYQVPESEIVVDDREIPKHWRRCYGMDVGWNKTACSWFATDPDTNITYLYHEYYRGQAEPAVHSQGIKAPGNWIPGAIDPAARGRGQADGHSLAELYQGLGLQLTYADNSVEAGIYQVWEMLSSGRLKIFKSCRNWLAEYRVYRRDEKGRIVKDNDHLMDATRYGIMTGLGVAKVKPLENHNNGAGLFPQNTSGWMA